MDNLHPPGSGNGSYTNSNDSSMPPSGPGTPVRQAQRSANDPDFSEPIVFHRATTKRLHEALWGVGLVACCTLIAFLKGSDAGGMARFASVLVLLVLWIAALLYLFGAVRYSVQLNEEGVTVFQGFLRRQVRWDDAFIAEWKAHHTCVEEEITHTTWTLEIRDALGLVKIRVDGDMLDPHDRRLLGHLILQKLEQGRYMEM
jgi:uncharacterized membrane protein